MKICIATDFHLSYKQYGLEAREQDFYKQYEKMINSIIEEKPHVLLILGDIFDTPYPKPISIKKFEDGLDKLQENNIRTYGIIGNHTMIQRKNYYPIDRIFDDKYHLLNEDGIILDDIFIGGLNYHPKNHDIKPLVDKIYEKARGYRVKILLLHQILMQDQNIGYDYDEDDLELGRFDYVFLGHLHRRLTRHTGNTIIHYPGSLNSCNVPELVDEMKYGRGYTVLDTDKLEMHYKTLSPQRKYVQYNIRDDELNDKFIEESIESLKSYDVKPIVMLEIIGNNAKDIYEFSKKLEDWSLIVKQNFQFEEHETFRENDRNIFMDNGVEGLIGEHFDDEWKSDLAIGLFRALKDGDVEGALEISKEVYDKTFI